MQAQIEELDAALQAEIASLDATYHPATEPLETISLKPKRTGIQVQLVALVWVAMTDVNHRDTRTQRRTSDVSLGRAPK